MAGRIFVNYRRDDSPGHAISVAQHLEKAFGKRKVFLDIDMRAGENFPTILKERLAASKVMVAVIGPRWLELRNEAGQRRLDDPDDWVRLEIATALSSGVVVIPVLVGGATLPRKADLPPDLKSLTDQQAVTITTNSFRTAMGGLTRDLQAMPGPRSWGLFGSGAAAVLLVLLGGWVGAHQLGVPLWAPWQSLGHVGAVAELANKSAAGEAAHKATVEQQRLALVTKQEEDRNREAEAARKAAAEQQRLALVTKQEEDRKRDEAEAARKAAAEQQHLALLTKQEEDRKRDEAEAARKAEAEQQRLALLRKQEENRKRDEAEAARKAEAAQQHLALLKRQEEERRRDEAEATRKAEAEQQRLALLKRQEEERKRVEAEAARKAEADKAEAAKKTEAEQQRLTLLRQNSQKAAADATRSETVLSGSQRKVFRDPLASGKPCANCPEMVEVPQGTFMMGSPKNEPQRDDDEEPRRVQITRSFAASRFPVTVEQFSAFVAATNHNAGTRCHAFNGQKMEMNAPRSWQSPGFEQGNDHPVVCVNWQDAQAFVGWLSSTTGKTYRLLSESEREYITRAGATTPFWWGTSISPDQANYDARSTYPGGGQKGDFRQRTVPVDSFKPNSWGFHNVHGNVWDWTTDCFHPGQAGKKDKGSADAASNCQMRVVRGGSWFNTPSNLRSANRTSEYSGSRSAITGFRVARDLSESKP